MNILQAINDSKVFGAFFKGRTWEPWKCFLAALFALPLTPEQLAIYRKHTGRTTPPAQPLHEAWLVIGRRGGKSFILAVIAVFLACFTDWRPYLGPGEVATIMIIARDRKQARVIKRFITGLLHEVKMLKRVIEAETQDSIQLKNRVSIEIHTASFRSTRGYTIVAALLDEVAFWEMDESSAEPDTEVINAIKPGMATIPGAMLLCASSPHARRGALWDAYRRHYGQDGDEVLIWQADTRSMNATVPQSYIDKHVVDDPARAAAEYGAIFRSDIEAFVPREVVEAAVISGRRELPSMNGVSYVAYLDPSGGTSDSMTVAIAHRGRDGHGVLDAARERRPPFSPEAVVIEFATLLKSYGIKKVIGDRFGGEFVRRNVSRRASAKSRQAANNGVQRQPKAYFGKLRLPERFCHGP
jgi:terminase large subunit-like protein